MNPKPSLLPVDKINEAIQIEPVLMFLLLVIGSWVFYKIFLKKVSQERHQNLKRLFNNVYIHTIIALALYSIYTLMLAAAGDVYYFQRMIPYVGLLTIIWGIVVFIKTSRIATFMYLFLGHMKEGVPLLMVNIFSLVLSIGFALWIATQFFGFNLSSLLATSAIVSVVLGLAMQDTLGNLFAGLAMQFDKPYRIGDWIEVEMGVNRWKGQVDEISWRATVLIGLADETITIPNRTMGQAFISNYTISGKPFVKSQMFRLPLNVDVDQARYFMLQALKTIEGIRHDLSSGVLINEVHDSWLSFKIWFYLDDYGKQFGVADKVYTVVSESLVKNKIELAHNIVQVNLKEKSQV